MCEIKPDHEIFDSTITNSDESENALKDLSIKMEKNDSKIDSNVDVSCIELKVPSDQDKDLDREQDLQTLQFQIPESDYPITTDLKSDVMKSEMVASVIEELFNTETTHEKLNGCTNSTGNSEKIDFLKESDVNHNIIMSSVDKVHEVEVGNGDQILRDDEKLQKEINFPESHDYYADDLKDIDQLPEETYKGEVESIKISDSLDHTHKSNIGIEKVNDVVESEKSDKNSTGTENFVDILGNGLLTKRILVQGLGRETRPTHGDSVTIQYKGWNSTGELIDENEVSFVLGDGDMIQAFDLGICLAERHEEFELKTDSRFAYGTYGWEPKVKPDEALTYRIKLLQVDDPPEYSTFSYENRMKAADVKRERGNYLYRREEYPLAVNSYSRAIKIIETDPDYKKANTDTSKADMYDLFIKVTNNLAAAQLKLESYDNVIETCNTILNYDASNVKALFRKGKSLSMKGNYDEAIPILKRALELENSKLVAAEIQRCYQLKRAEDEQRARVCRKMFGVRPTDDNDKCRSKIEASGWKNTIYKYSPYIGGVIVTAFSIVLASLAIAKSKDN